MDELGNVENGLGTAADDPANTKEGVPVGVAKLKAILNTVPYVLGRISEESASSKASPDAWSAKQELGHLVDSAANNHVRLVLAQVQENPALKEYDGDGWVAIHNYQNRAWREIVDCWTCFNQQLLATAESAPLSAWSRGLSVGNSGPLTLRYIIDDYVRHLTHHLQHIGILVDEATEPGYPEKLAQADQHLISFIRRRWSPAAFDPSRPVEREKLLRLMEAARWAPSCFNEQPWRYLIFDESDPVAREAARDCLVAGNAYAREAPILILSVAYEDFTQNGKPNRFGQHDTGMSDENLVLQAVAEGLVAHQMAGYDAERARREFQIPDRYTTLSMIAVGYPYTGLFDGLPEKTRDREKRPRSRRSLSEIAFGGKWGAPLK